MAVSTYNRTFAAMIAEEGGYTNHRADKGGPTNLGVTQGTLSRWLGRPATIAEIKALTRETVKPIYKVNYANAVRYDELPPGIDYLAFDLAVNSGPRRAAVFLQEILGMKDADGFIGPATVRAAWAVFNRDRRDLIDRYVERFKNNCGNDK